MKKVVFLAVLMGLSGLAQAGYVHGYTRSNGTYVQGHYRSEPNSTRADNYGPSRGTSTPYYSRDNDRDGIPNQYDSDDNNNGRHDDTDSCQYCIRP